MFIALLLWSFDYIFAERWRDFYDLLPNEFGYPQIIEKNIEVSCFSVIYSLDKIPVEKITKVRSEEKLVSRRVGDLEKETNGLDQPSDQYIFDKFSTDLLANDMGKKSDTLSIGLGCGEKRDDYFKNEISREVYGGVDTYYSFNRTQNMAMVMNLKRNILILVSYN